MDTEGLTMICAGLGLANEDDDGSVIGYTKTEYCLDNLKDMQRYLRRDDPLKRNVFKQLCKWNTVSRDLIPLMEFHQTERNLVITIVKVLVFLTMPVDPTSDDVSQQIECLWGLKAALTRNTTIAVIVSLLEDPLYHLERDVFSEEDWKLVQLVLTLFRNLLAVQEVSAQQKACGSASQFLAVRDKFLEILFMENFMDLVLVLTQHVDDTCGYLRQDNLLLLEIFYYVFLGQDPALIVQVSKGDSKEDGDMSTALDSLISIIEDEAEQRRNIIQRDLGRHSQFSGTFSRLTVDGSKTLFKRNPASASGEALLKAHKVQRGQLKRTAWDKGFLSFPKDSILELLHNFLIQLLSGGYNVLMQSVREDIEKEHHAIQHSDVILFFQVAHFVTAFQYKASITKKQKTDDASESSQDQGRTDDLFSGNICGPIAATMNEGMFYLVISKWREAFESLKETQDYKTLSAAGSLMKYMIRMLDVVLKLLLEIESNEPQLARILLYKIFYDQTEQGFTHFLLHLFKSFDIHKQPKSDLADLLEMIYITLRLMEKLQARGTLKVFKKSRGRKKKNLKDKSEETVKLKEQAGAQVSNGTPHDGEGPISNSCTDANKFLGEQLADFNCVHEEGILTSDATREPFRDTEKNMDHDSSHKHINELDEGIVGEVCETEELYNDDHQITTNEVDFNVTKMFTNFTNSAVIRNLCWLLKYYKSNSASTNHYIICMLKKICDDLDLAPMLYQLSVLTTFYGILADKKASKSKHYANIMDFLTKFVRKMLRTLKNQPLLFIDILFWKTRKECHCINADAMIRDIGNLKKDFRCWEGEGGPPMGRGPQGWRSIADSLGDDEADFGVTNDHNKPLEGTLVDQTLDSMHKSKRSVLDSNEDEFDINSYQTEISSLGNEIQKAGSEKKKFCDQVQESTIKDSNQSHARKRIRALTDKQESEIRALYEQFKDQKRCSYMIAKALDDGNTYTAAQISRKLRQLGIASQKKRFSKANKPLEDGGLRETEKLASGEALQHREKKNRNRLQNANNAETGTSEDDLKQILSTLHKRKRNKFPRQEYANTVTIEPDSENETLSNLYKKVTSPHGSPRVKYGHNKHNVPLYTDDSPSTELENTSSRDNDIGRSFTFDDELMLEDFTASEDDIDHAQNKVARRSLKMVIDAEDDEDF